MDLLDLWPEDLVPLMPKPERVRKPTAVPSDPIGNNTLERNRNFDASSSFSRRSRRHIESSKPRFACPFLKHHPPPDNHWEYLDCLLEKFTDISTLTEHIQSEHSDEFLCSECNRNFRNGFCLRSHHCEQKVCHGDVLFPRLLPQCVSPSILTSMSTMRKFQKRQTAEEEWQDIYHHLFPNDDRTFSPYFESSFDQSYHESESGFSNSSRGATPSMTTASTIDSEVQPMLHQGRVSTYYEPIYPNVFLEQDLKSLGTRYESQIPEPQAPLDHHLGAYEPLDPLDHYLRTHKPLLARDDNPFRRETRSPATSSLSTGGDFGGELSTSNSKESPSSPSEQSTESFEEDETQHSDLDGIDSHSRTYLSFDPVKRALFDNSTRQFWDFYNNLSFSDLSILWSKHATYKGATSSPQGTQTSTSTTPDTQTPSKILSNAASSLLPPKRKKKDDEDEPNNNQTPSKRPNRTSLKKSLNLACPFHKYKPWEYNDGILRFRTCSTTPFDAIFRLKEHLRRVHSPPIYCTRCGLSFANQQSLVDHGQANNGCERKDLLPVVDWTAEMDKRIKKQKDETEEGCWGRIYCELFGATLANPPSPCSHVGTNRQTDFVPYDLVAANEARLETRFHQELPRIMLNLLSEQVKNMEIPDAARALFDPTAPHFQFEELIGIAIRDFFIRYRSVTATADNPEAPPTPQSSPVNPSIAGDSSTVQSATSESTPIDSSQSSHHQLGSSEPLPAVAPNNTIHPIATGEPSYSGHSHEQAPPPATELASHALETASNLSPPNPPSQLQSGGYMQQDGHYYDPNAYGGSMSECLFGGLDLDRSFDYQALLNMSFGPDGAPACP